MILYVKIAITALLSMPFLGFSQSTALYNADASLKADRQFRITKDALSKMPAIEKDLLPTVYNNLKYPAVAKDNSYTGMAIVKFTVVKGQVSFEIVKFVDEIFKDVVNRFFKAMPEWQLRSKAGKHGDMVFYLPIKFQIIKDRFKKTLSANKMLTIEALEAVPDPIVTDDAVYIKNE